MKSVRVTKNLLSQIILESLGVTESCKVEVDLENIYIYETGKTKKDYKLIGQISLKDLANLKK